MSLGKSGQPDILDPDEEILRNQIDPIYGWRRSPVIISSEYLSSCRTLKTMTAAEKLYQLLQALPESQINEILNFAESLHKKQLATPQPMAIPPGTLTGLRGIAKRPGAAPSDHKLQEEYTDYLTQKYQ
jgi:hypothetical protein